MKNQIAVIEHFKQSSSIDFDRVLYVGTKESTVSYFKENYDLDEIDGYDLGDSTLRLYDSTKCRTVDTDCNDTDLPINGSGDWAILRASSSQVNDREVVFVVTEYREE